MDITSNVINIGPAFSGKRNVPHDVPNRRTVKWHISLFENKSSLKITFDGGKDFFQAEKQWIGFPEN
jgi:hypothetical protein